MTLSTLRTAAGLTRLAGPYVALAALKRLVPLHTLARWTWRAPRGPRNPERERRIIAQTIKLGHLSRSRDRDCLQRSLLLYRELSRAGADPSLMIGFERVDEGDVAGHAWIVVDGRPVAESAEAIARLVPTCVFGRHGNRERTPLA
jgi:hypothetical protein